MCHVVLGSIEVGGKVAHDVKQRKHLSLRAPTIPRHLFAVSSSP